VSLLAELKRRNVIRVGVAYAVVTWLVLQVADVMIDNIGAPEWFFQGILLVLAIGFPVVLIFAWAFEMTPEGIKREKDVDRSQSITPQTGRKLDRAIIVVLVLALAYFLWERQTGRSPQAEPVDSAETALEKSIAVLPFVNMSADADNEYFSDGLSEELLNLLAKVDGLKVAARTSSFKFKGSEADIGEIGQRLNVATVLEGSVRKAGNQVRITAQLIKVDDGFHLWSETYDRSLDNIFQVQDEIATAIVDALKLPLLGHDAQPLSAPSTESFAAYDLYLLGRHHARAQTAEGFERAIDHYQRALGSDPNFAPAHAGLADAYIFLANYGDLPQGEAQQLAREAVQQALTLNPGLAEAQTSMGLLLNNLNRYDEAEQHFQRALQINPNHVNALLWYGNVLDARKQLLAALDLSERALELDPLSSPVRRSRADRLISAGRFNEALVVIQDMIAANPDDPTPYEIWGDLFRAQGLPHRAIPMYRNAHRLRPGDIYMAAWNTLSGLELDAPAVADYWLEQARARGGDGQWTRFAEMHVLYARGRGEALLELTGQLLESRPGQAPLLVIRGMAQMQLGQTETAVETLQKALVATGYQSGQDLSLDQLEEALQLANALQVLGRDAEFGQLVTRIAASLAKDRGNEPADAELLLLEAQAAALRGDLAGTLRHLEEAIVLGARGHWELLFNPLFLRWQDNPRFQALHRRMLDEAAVMRREYLANNPEAQREAEGP
jgi:TolB-like protein/Tfp pilus assembly protein PilF